MVIRKVSDPPLPEGRGPVRAPELWSALALAALVVCVPSGAQAQQAAPAPAAPAPAAPPAGAPAPSDPAPPAAPPAGTPAPNDPASPAPPASKDDPNAAARPPLGGPVDPAEVARQLRELQEQVRLLTATVQQLQAEKNAAKAPVLVGLPEGANGQPADPEMQRLRALLRAPEGANGQTTDPELQRLRALLMWELRKRFTPVAGDQPDDSKQGLVTETQSGQTADRLPSYEPGYGFTVAKTQYGTLNIGGYTVFRYLNQMPSDGEFRDHLGRERPTIARNDIEWHRALLYVRGWLFDPKFTYQNNVWGLQSSQQMMMVGSLAYRFSPSLNANGGIYAHPGIFELLGNFPLWLGTDRVMAAEYFRPGFSGGFWLDGTLANKAADYRLFVGNTISQLGVAAFNLTRNHSYALELGWMPTTKEYGPRRSLGDFEGHKKAATRFDLFYTHSREDRASQPSETAPDNTQIRLSDSVLFFETGALAPGVTVQRANYDLLAAHAGVKYRGNSLDVQYYRRWLTNMLADGKLPMDSINDQGFSVQTSRMIVARKLMLYGVGGYVDGAFNTSWEVGAGMNYYPFRERNVRVNVQGLYVNKSPTSSQFGYYTGGMTGPILSIATDVLF